MKLGKSASLLALCVMAAAASASTADSSIITDGLNEARTSMINIRYNAAENSSMNANAAVTVGLKRHDTDLGFMWLFYRPGGDTATPPAKMLRADAKVPAAHVGSAKRQVGHDGSSDNIRGDGSQYAMVIDHRVHVGIAG